jgi:hypothetical protein
MTKTRTDKYVLSFCVAGLGMIAVASPLFLKLGSQMPDYMASERHTSEQQRFRNELDERQKTSEKINQTGLVLAAETLILNNYLDDPKKLPKLRKTDLNRYGKDKQAWVYDASDKCIGIIRNKKFISKHHKPSVCDKLPNHNDYDNTN